MTFAELLELASLQQLIPPLSPTAYKGQAGKVGVLGGCADYTGAPYYAAISALKLGCDLSHVFCDERAAGPIKSYSPELIVHGCLREGERHLDSVDDQVHAVTKWFPQLTALVVGPGLGRDETLQVVALRVLESAAACNLPCVIDADGLWSVLKRPELVKRSRWTVLTPNKPEYARLLKVFPETVPGVAASHAGSEAVLPPDEQQHQALSLALGGPVLVRKGAEDLIGDFEGRIARNVEPGCLKRSGGQGDVLAGTIATWLSWARAAEQGDRLPAPMAKAAPFIAAYAGCLLTRRFSAAAFARHRRSMTAPDLIETIGPVFEDLFPTHS